MQGAKHQLTALKESSSSAHRCGMGGGTVEVHRMQRLPALVEQAASLRNKPSLIILLMHLPYVQPKQLLPTDSPALGEALQAEQEQLICSEKSVRSHSPLKSDGLVPWLLPHTVPL